MFKFLFREKVPVSKIQSCSLLDIINETDDFFKKLIEEFSFPLFDEILILRKLNYGYEFVHHKEYSARALADIRWKDRVIDNIDIFLGRIPKKQALADGEGVFTWNQESAPFDLIVRAWEFYIVLNDSTDSLRILTKKHTFDEIKLVQFLKQFAENFNQKHEISSIS